MRLKKIKNIAIQWLKCLEKILKLDLSKYGIIDEVLSNSINVNIITKSSWVGIMVRSRAKIISLFVINKKEKKGIWRILI